MVADKKAFDRGGGGVSFDISLKVKKFVLILEYHSVGEHYFD